MSKIAEIFLCMWILLFSVGIVKIGNIPIKMFLSLIFIFMSILSLVNKNRIYIFQTWNIFIMGIGIVVAVFIGFVNGFYLSTVDHALSFCATIGIIVCFLNLYDNHLLDIEKIRKVIIFTAFSGVLFKVILDFCILGGFVSALDVEEIMQNQFGSSAFDVGIGVGFLGILPRIGDGGALFNLVVYSFYAKKNNGGTMFIWLLMLLFVFVCYSRYLIACFVCITVVIIGCYIQEVRFSLKHVFSIAFFIIICINVVNYIGIDLLTLGFVERYIGHGQGISDSFRILQAQAMLPIIEENFLWGIGLGGYTTECLRSDIHFWQYELEYMALFMQLGVVGFLFIICNYIQYISKNLWRGYEMKMKVPMLLSFVFFLITPLESALLVGTPATLIFISIFSCSRQLGKV